MAQNRRTRKVRVVDVVPEQRSRAAVRPTLPSELLQAAMDGAAVGQVLTWVKVRDMAEQQVQAAVNEARQAGVTWEAIGEGLGMSKQGAQRRYGSEAAPR